jgi:hypothetical protein
MCTDVYALPAGERKARYAALAQDIDGLQGGRPVDANAVKQWMWQQAFRIKKQGQGVRKGAGEDVLAGLPMFGTPPPPPPAPTLPETVLESAAGGSWDPDCPFGSLAASAFPASSGDGGGASPPPLSKEEDEIVVRLAAAAVFPPPPPPAPTLPETVLESAAGGSWDPDCPLWFKSVTRDGVWTSPR